MILPTEILVPRFRTFQDSITTLADEDSEQLKQGDSLDDSPEPEDVFVPLKKINTGSKVTINQSDNTPRTFWGTVINFGRRCWKIVRKYSPITWLFNYIEDMRCSECLENARNRNGADPSKPEQIAAYHDSLRANNFFTSHFPEGHRDKPKRLVVICLGNGQDPKTAHEHAGLRNLYDRLVRDNDVDVLLVTGPCAVSEGRLRLFMSSDGSRHSSVVVQHLANVIEDRIKIARPSQITFVGYSMGAGCIDELLENHWGRIGDDTPIETAYGDGIQPTLHNLGDAVVRRPRYSRRHANFYQLSTSNGINGGRLLEVRENDISEEIHGVNHTTIDNNPDVLDSIYRFIRR